jgi:hypothetical protein
MMKTLTKSVVSIALLAAAFAVGCGTSSGTDDAGIGGTAGTGAGGAGGDPCAGATLFAISPGDSCFDIVSVTPGSNDGCMLGVADTVANMGLLGSSLPVNYTFDMMTGTLTVGTMGSLGAGPVLCNVGTLTRDNNPTLMTNMSCTWHQSDTSNITVTATNEFDISVTEAEDMFMGCVAADNILPTGGQCMSTWTWHMKKSDTKSPSSTPPCM